MQVSKCAARGSLKIQAAKKSPKIAIWTPSCNCQAISSQLRHASTTGKKSVKQQCPSDVPTIMVNFGPLTVEIGSGVWGTPANFNGFCVSSALLHGSQVVSVSQTAALNRGCHLCSAGRPSRWALAHILVVVVLISIGSRGCLCFKMDCSD